MVATNGCNESFNGPKRPPHRSFHERKAERARKRFIQERQKLHTTDK
jgi:hypothetical protein